MIIKNKKVLIIFLTSILFIYGLMCVLFFFGNDLIYLVRHRIDPCFQRIEGKGAFWHQKGNRICVRERYYMKSLENFDINTFKKYSDLCFGDKKNVYCDNEIIIEADPKTFRQIDNSNYYVDKDNLFYQGKMVESVSTEYVIVDENCLKNKNKVIYGGNEVEGADAETFESIDEFIYRDKNWEYTIDYRNNINKLKHLESNSE